MLWIVLAVICVIIVVAGFLVQRVIKKDEYDLPKWLGWAIMGGGIALLVLFTLWSSVTMVGQREVGVVSTFGQITGQLSPGMQAVMPWQSVQKQSIAIESYQVQNHEAFSKETSPVYYTATLNWHVEPTAVQSLYKSVGPKFFDTIIPARFDEAFKSVVTNYAAVDVTPNRDKIRQAVLDVLKTTLGQYSISADDLNINNIDFDKEFRAAIIEKQVAAQKALAAQNKVQQAQYEADQLVKTAQGKAEATKIEGEMLAKYPGIIQMRAIEKLNDNVQVMLLPSNSQYILPSTIFQQGQ